VGGIYQRKVYDLMGSSMIVHSLQSSSAMIQPCISSKGNHSTFRLDCLGRFLVC
jgi:hypothetical protein